MEPIWIIKPSGERFGPIDVQVKGPVIVVPPSPGSDSFSADRGDKVERQGKHQRKEQRVVIAESIVWQGMSHTEILAPVVVTKPNPNEAYIRYNGIEMRPATVVIGGRESGFYDSLGIVLEAVHTGGDPEEHEDWAFLVAADPFTGPTRSWVLDRNLGLPVSSPLWTRRYEKRPSASIAELLENGEVELIDYFARHPRKVDKLTPDQFEALVEAIYKNLGFTTERVGAWNQSDGGIDIVAVKKTDAGTELRIGIQCKATKNKVSAQPIRELAGVLGAHQLHQGIVATTSRFTRSAVREATGTYWNISLQDRDDLTRRMLSILLPDLSTPFLTSHPDMSWRESSTKAYLVRAFIKSALALPTIVFSGCTAGRGAPSPLASRGTVAVWVTTGDQSRLLAREPDLHFNSVAVDSSIPVIEVDYSREFQSVVGWGAAMTDASAYLIQTKLSATQREALLQELFGREPGIGLSFVRIPMGASDFSRSHYSYDDRPAGETDSTLAHFSIDVDRAEKIPALKRALAINPQLKLMGSPWSAPGWMKSSGSLIKGTLLPQFYGAFAEYFRRWIEAYGAEGLPIFAITLQNEPHFEPDNYPGMRLSPAQRAAIIGGNYGPALREARHSRADLGLGPQLGRAPVAARCPRRFGRATVRGRSRVALLRRRHLGADCRARQASGQGHVLHRMLGRRVGAGVGRQSEVVRLEDGDRQRARMGEGCRTLEPRARRELRSAQGRLRRLPRRRHDQLGDW